MVIDNRQKLLFIINRLLIKKTFLKSVKYAVTVV